MSDQEKPSGTLLTRVRRVWLGLSTLTTLCSLLQFGAASRTCAQEVISQEETTPSSVDEIVTPIERSFIDRIPRPGFFRDTQLDLNLRSFYFQRDKYGDDVNAAWAMGGALAYQSGWLLDRLK